MLLWILLGVAVWIIGAVVFYILDGWFDYQFENDAGLFCFIAAIWPIWIWFVIPGILAGKAHDSLKEKKRIYLEKKEALQKIRVAQEKEIETIEEELEKYVEESRKAS
jgi:hypothetical protein